MNADQYSEADTPNVNIAHIYGAVLGVGVACALAIVTVYEMTKPVIERNRQAQLRQAVLDVLPRAEKVGEFQYRASTNTIEPSSIEFPNQDLIYAGFDARGDLVGLALEAKGMGYQDQIRLLYGYSFDQQAVIGIRVLESRETPGLGDRVQSDPDFLRNFESLDVRLNAQRDAVANRIEFVKSGDKSEAWQVDGITGATISSQAIARMLSESTVQWIPRLHGQRNAFVIKKGETP